MEINIHKGRNDIYDTLPPLDYMIVEIIMYATRQLRENRSTRGKPGSRKIKVSLNTTGISRGSHIQRDYPRILQLKNLLRWHSELCMTITQPNT